MDFDTEQKFSIRQNASKLFNFYHWFRNSKNAVKAEKNLHFRLKNELFFR